MVSFSISSWGRFGRFSISGFKRSFKRLCWVLMACNLNDVELGPILAFFNFELGPILAFFNFELGLENVVSNAPHFLWHVWGRCAERAEPN